MIKRNLQIILAVVTFAAVMTVLPGSLQAKWDGCTSHLGGGCSLCADPYCYDPRCNDPKPSYPVSGTVRTSDDRLIKYTGSCCVLKSACLKLACGFGEICNPDVWTKCGIENMCGDRWTAHATISKWVCTIDPTADNYEPLGFGDKVLLTATTEEASGYTPEWKCLDEDGNERQCVDKTENVSVDLAPDGSTATVSNPRGKGKITIRVQDPFDEKCYGEIQLNVNVECEISLSVDKAPLPLGDTAIVTADTDIGDEITWSWEPVNESAASLEPIPDGKEGKITPTWLSGEGWVRIRAQDP